MIKLKTLLLFLMMIPYAVCSQTTEYVSIKKDPFSDYIPNTFIPVFEEKPIKKQSQRTHSKVSTKYISNRTKCLSNRIKDFSCAFETVTPSVLRVASGYKINNKFIPSRVGSGVVWSQERYIITNAHVIESDSLLRARTYSGHVIQLKVIGIDQKLDIAVLAARIPKDLLLIPPISLAKKDPKPGQWVAAIGHPYQMSYSLSTGAISALHRNDLLDDWKGNYPGFIQTDLTLNPGNSGGPLVNLQGEMLGLNTAVLGAGQGLSFALPLSRLVPVINKIKNQGVFDRSYVGLKLRNVSYKRARKAHISIHQAVRIVQVVENSPADLAGLSKDDLITHVDDKPFANPAELSWYFISSIPEYPIVINFIRVKKKMVQHYTTVLTPAPIPTIMTH